MQTKKLYRSCNNRIVAGIAGGLGEYLEIDPTIIRLIFIILMFSGIGFAAYIIGWVLIPTNPNCKNGKEGAEEISEKAKEIADEFRQGGKNSDTNLRVIIGAIILAFGLLLLFENIVGPFVWKVFWPAVLILIGFYFIAKSTEK